MSLRCFLDINFRPTEPHFSFTVLIYSVRTGPWPCPQSAYILTWRRTREPHLRPHTHQSLHQYNHSTTHTHTHTQTLTHTSLHLHPHNTTPNTPTRHHNPQPTQPQSQNHTTTTPLLISSPLPSPSDVLDPVNPDKSTPSQAGSPPRQ